MPKPTTAPSHKLSAIDKRERVLNALITAAEPLTIYQLGRICFPGVRPSERGDSWVRNALRALLESAAVRQVGPGTYEATT